jgi:hypothetical protein
MQKNRYAWKSEPDLGAFRESWKRILRRNLPRRGTSGQGRPAAGAGVAHQCLVARDLVRRAAAGAVRIRASRTGRDSSPRPAGSAPETRLRRAARAMVMRPVSSGSRKASSAARGNSGSSSRNSTPWCASEISPGPRRRAAAHQRHGTGRVVRRAGRPLRPARQRRSGRPGWRPRRFPAPRHRHRRQQAGEALRQHRLARAGRADQQAANGRPPPRSPARAGRRPALHVGQVGIVRARAGALHAARRCPAVVLGAAASPRLEVPHHVQQVPRPPPGRPAPARPPPRCRRQHQPRRTFRGMQAPGWWPARRAPAAVRPTATARRRTRSRPARAVDLPAGGQDAQRDRQVEAAGVLGQVGRRQVDRDPLVVREVQPAGEEAERTRSRASFTSVSGQADQHEVGQAEGQVHLDRDAAASRPTRARLCTKDRLTAMPSLFGCMAFRGAAGKTRSHPEGAKRRISPFLTFQRVLRLRLGRQGLKRLWMARVLLTALEAFLNKRRKTQMKLKLAVLLLASLVLSGAALAQTKAPEPDYTLSYNVGAVTDYRYPRHLADVQEAGHPGRRRLRAQERLVPRHLGVQHQVDQGLQRRHQR